VVGKNPGFYPCKGNASGNAFGGMLASGLYIKRWSVYAVLCRLYNPWLCLEAI